MSLLRTGSLRFLRRAYDSIKRFDIVIVTLLFMFGLERTVRRYYRKLFEVLYVSQVFWLRNWASVSKIRGIFMNESRAFKFCIHLYPFHFWTLLDNLALFIVYTRDLISLFDLFAFSFLSFIKRGMRDNWFKGMIINCPILYTV